MKKIYVFNIMKFKMKVGMEVIRVGGKVVVVGNGCSYLVYDTMFEKLGFSNTYYNECLGKGSVGTVFAIGNCDTLNAPRYAVRTSDGKEALYNNNGIKLISSADPLDNVGREVYLIRDDKIIKERINKAMVTREEKHDRTLNPVEAGYFFNNLGIWVDVDRVYFTKEDIIKGL